VKGPEKPIEYRSSSSTTSLYRRKTEKGDLIVLSVGSSEDGENLITSVELDGVCINVAVIPGTRIKKEREIPTAKAVSREVERD
jgi:hypothetical protein